MVVVSIYEDTVLKRGNEYNSIRDNLIFEHALGIGYYGRENSILVIPNTVTNTTGPTDLNGMTHLFYNEFSVGYDSLDKISRKLIKHLNDNNKITFPEKGIFGLNLLSDKTIEITPGNYSFSSIIPKSQRLKVKFSPSTGIEWYMNMMHITQFILGDFINNSRIIENKPQESKEYDAEFNIIKGIGEIKIDFYEDNKIIKSNKIKVISN